MVVKAQRYTRSPEDLTKQTIIGFPFPVMAAKPDDGIYRKPPFHPRHKLLKYRYNHGRCFSLQEVYLG